MEGRREGQKEEEKRERGNGVRKREKKGGREGQTKI